MTPIVLQFIKYALAGVVATGTHIFFFHLVGWKLFPCLTEKDHLVRLLSLQIRPVNDYSRARNSMISNIIAFMFSCLVGYIMNVMFVFQAGRHHVVIEILLFYGVSAISSGLGTALMGILIRRFGLLTTFAFGANIFTSVMLNFVVRKYLIFNG